MPDAPRSLTTHSAIGARTSLGLSHRSPQPRCCLNASQSLRTICPLSPPQVYCLSVNQMYRVLSVGRFLAETGREGQAVAPALRIKPIERSRDLGEDNLYMGIQSG